MKAFQFHFDGGNGWLRVTHQQLDETGMSPSRFSYHDDQFAYLEEDCDASEFRDLWQANREVEGLDTELRFTEVNDGSVSFIRSLPRLGTGLG